jgi:hypothetical protein
MTAGDIYTVAGDGNLDHSGDGGPARSAGMDPAAVAVDRLGDLLVADSQFNDRVRLVAESTGTVYGLSVTAGDIYTVAGDGTLGFNGDGIAATAAQLQIPLDSGVAVDAADNLLITDNWNERIRVVAASSNTFYGQAMTEGDIYTIAGNGTFGFAGDGGPATAAELRNPDAVAVDTTGNVILADSGNSRMRAIATSGGTFYGVVMTAGDIYTIAGGGSATLGDGGPATAAQLGVRQFGVAVDPHSNLFIADAAYSRVRRVTGP